MKYEKLIQGILQNVGGADNIQDAVHCATRLRLRLKDDSMVNEEVLKEMDGVLQVIKLSGQFQIVIGTHVNMVYKEFMDYIGRNAKAEVAEENIKDAATMKAEMKEKKVKSSLIDLISGIFSPVLGIMMATGFLKGILTLLSAVGLLESASGTYQILYMAADCFFYFLPVFLGYTAMKKFGGSPFVGMALGLILLYLTISTLMAGESIGTIFSGTMFEADIYVEFLGIPVMLRNYSSTVFPVIVICFVAAKIEKFLEKRMPVLINSFMTPCITLVISSVLGLLLVGPVVSIVSDLLGQAVSFVFGLNSLIGGFIYGAIIQFCVIFGVHWGFVAISINNFATLGYDPVTIAGLSSAFAQVGVAIVIMIKTRNKKLKNVCAPAIISGFFGITEPVIYGITLQNKRAFILASAASAVGGAIIGGAGVKQYTMGANGIFGWLQVINPAVGFDATVLAAIIACAVSLILGIVLMATVGKKSIE